MQGTHFFHSLPSLSLDGSSIFQLIRSFRVNGSNVSFEINSGKIHTKIYHLISCTQRVKNVHAWEWNVDVFVLLSDLDILTDLCFEMNRLTFQQQWSWIQSMMCLSRDNRFHSWKCLLKCVIEFICSFHLLIFNLIPNFAHFHSFWDS